MKGGESKQSVLLLTRSLNVGGAERQLIHLARGLSSRGHSVQVALFYRGGVLDNELISLGIPLIDLRKGGRWDIIGFLARLRSIVAAAKPDVVYSFLGTANVTAAAIRPLVRVRRLVWSIRASDMDSKRYDWLVGLNYRLECVISRWADLIISNSFAGMQHAIDNGFPGDRIRVVPNGIDTERFRPSPAARNAARERWGIRPEQTVIGMLARLDAMKDYPTFLDAAARIAKVRDDVRFVCVGEGSEQHRAELVARGEQLGLAGRLLWPGRSDCPEEDLNGLDVYCSSSAFGEGFSNSIGEAMACGLTCVVTDVGDSAILVGDAGLIVPRRDPAALSEGLLMAINNSRGPSHLARQRIVDHYSIDRMVETTLDLLIRPLSPIVSPLGGKYA